MLTEIYTELHWIIEIHLRKDQVWFVHADDLLTGKNNRFENKYLDVCWLSAGSLTQWRATRPPTARRPMVMGIVDPPQQQQKKGDETANTKEDNLWVAIKKQSKSRTAPLPPTTAPSALHSGMTIRVPQPPCSELGYDDSDYDSPPALCSRAWLFWLR